MDTRLRWVDPIPFRGTGRQWTIPITSTQPAAPTLGSMVSLEPRAGKQLRVRGPGLGDPAEGRV
jgi:hypothetical protein